MVYTQYGMIGLAFIASFVMPESPWWLISKGKTQAARKILTSKFANVEGYDIDTELVSRAAQVFGRAPMKLIQAMIVTGNY